MMFVSRLRSDTDEYERFGAARRAASSVEDVALRFARDAESLPASYDVFPHLPSVRWPSA